MKLVTSLSFIVVTLSSSLAWAQAPSNDPKPPTFEIVDFGVVPMPAVTDALLQFPVVDQELKISDAQKKEQAEIEKKLAEKLRQARTENEDRDKFRARRNAIVAERRAAAQARLKPEQWERLTQIQFQAQGPLAFIVRERGTGQADGRFVGPRLSEYLKLSGDQLKRAQKIAQESSKKIRDAASFRLPLSAKDKPSPEAIRKLVESPEFRALKEGARRSAREAWTAAIAQIEAVLSDDQRARYRELLGKPFDVSQLRFETMSETDFDVRAVARALEADDPRITAAQGAVGGGQRADPNFDLSVARPTFTSLHPRVAIDEAHDNFHTANGRYKPFADLMTNDGYFIERNLDQLTLPALARHDIVVIANATAPGARRPGNSSRSAFTELECSAIQRWVWDGGSLLLITDHEPYGSASEALAQRFGVIMNTSGIVDPANTDQESRGLVFSRDLQLVLDHPITLGRDPSEMINRVETFYGQALIGPVGSTPFLRFADSATYESTNGAQSAAGWAQGVALSYGAGRVVVMGEAAELSAQLGGGGRMGMNVPGIDNRQMALNIMHWLSRQLEFYPSAPVAATIYCAPRRGGLVSGWFKKCIFGQGGGGY